MQSDDFISLRTAAPKLEIDRATLGRLVAEQRVPEAGRRGGHAVYRLEDLRRAVDLDRYGYIQPTVETCDECWGFLKHHRDGKPCKPGSYERNQRKLLGGGP
jgi:hypothetical protein